MSTIKYCDGWYGECGASDIEVKLYTPNNSSVAEMLVKRKWFYSKYDIHICEKCIRDYYNEDEENIVINDSGYLILGKDFKLTE